MGRPPKPTAVHKALGSWRADRHSGEEPAPVGVLVKPELHGDASWCWDQIAEQLKANGVGSGDALLVLRLCQWWATAERCQARINGGNLEYLNAMSTASKHVEKLASMLGLSPTDRVKLRVQAKEQAGPKLADFKLA